MAERQVGQCGQVQHVGGKKEPKVEEQDEEEAVAHAATAADSGWLRCARWTRACMRGGALMWVATLGRS